MINEKMLSIIIGIPLVIVWIGFSAYIAYKECKYEEQQKVREE